MYALLIDSPDIKTGANELVIEKTGKAIPATVSNNLCFYDYLACICSSAEYSGSFFKFTSKNHRLHLTKNKKIIMRNFTDKRFLLNCGYHSRPYGHYLNTTDICNMCSDLE